MPTWNYQAIHAHGSLRIVDDEAEVLAQLTTLTAQHEATQTQPWQLDDAPQEWLLGLTRAIVCFEFTIEHLEGKYKMNQHHPQENRQGAIAGLRAMDNADAQHVAAVMQPYKK